MSVKSRIAPAVLCAALLALAGQTVVRSESCFALSGVTYTVSGGPGQIVIADFNGDGKPDIAAATGAGALVMLGNGDGTFAPGHTYGSGALGIAAADVNGDHRIDLALAGATSQAVIILLGNGSGGFGAPTSFPSGIAQAAVALGDVNGDGKVDVVLAGGDGSTIGNHNLAVLRGNGDGTFGAPATGNSGTNPSQLLLVDFNRDGRPDIATATSSHITHVSIELNNGDGTFTHSSTYNPFNQLIGIVSLAATDFNNDGKPDLVLTSSTAILMGTGSGTFSNDGVKYADGYAVAAGDINGDGKADVVMTNGSGLQVLLGHGDGTLGSPATYGSTALGSQVTLADVNGDGRLDVVTANGAANTISVLLNTSAACPPPPPTPTITSQPSSQVLHAGQTVTWTATATGTPAPTVQWQYSVNSGASWQDIGGATGTTYSFTAAVSDSLRQFRAVFTNASGTAATTPAGLTVTGDRPFVADFDGDGRADLAVWRPTDGTWYWLTSSSGYNPSASHAQQWGNQWLGDVPFLADIDGDGKADLIVWRATTGTWYWLTSSSGYNPAASGTRQWGNASLGDVPLVGDIDRDGKADLVVWRGSTGTFYWLTSSSGYDYPSQGQRQWGSQRLGDVPLLGDIDGDGRADLVVWRAIEGATAENTAYYWVTSSSGYVVQGRHDAWTAPQPQSHFLADVDGDHLADLILWQVGGLNPGQGAIFQWQKSSTAYASAAGVQWGAQGDTPLVADVDGDGLADFLVWRPSTGTWFWLTSSTGWSPASGRSVQWGSAGS